MLKLQAVRLQFKNVILMVNLLELTVRERWMLFPSFAGAIALMARGLYGLSSVLFQLARTGEDLSSLQFSKTTISHWPFLATLAFPIKLSLIILWPLILLLVGIAISQRTNVFLRNRFDRIRLDLRTRLFTTFMKVDRSILDSRGNYEQFNVLNRFSESLEPAFFSIFHSVQGLARGMTVIFFMIKLSWVLTAATLLMNLFFSVISQRFRQARTMNERDEAIGDEIDENTVSPQNMPYAQKNYDLKWTLSHLVILQGWGTGFQEQEKFSSYCRDLEKEHSLRPMQRMRPGSLDDILRIIRNLTLLVFSKLGFSVGGLKIAMLLGSQSKLQESTQKVLGLRQAFQDTENALNEINGVLEELKPPLAQAHPLDLETVSQGFKLRSVSYQVPSKKTPVLSNVTLDFTHGMKHGITGETGAGKSSLLLLLLRLAEPTAGKIYVGQTDVSDLSISKLRKSMAYVSQNPSVIDATLRANLLYGAKRVISESEIYEVVAALGLTPLIERNLLGLDCRLGRGGMRLSSGEAQRIELARAVLSEPEILLLDEATGSVESQVESRIMEWLMARFEHKTVIFVTHRLETLRFADRVYLFKNGELLEQGTDAEWRAQKGALATYLGKAA